MIPRPLPSVLALLLVAAPAAAGVVVDMETRELGRAAPGAEASQAPERGQLVIEGRRLKMNAPRGPGRESASTVLFDGEAAVMTVLDDARRTYFRVDRERVRSIGSQVGQAMQQVQQQLASLPPEQRAMVEKMMKSRMPAGLGPAAEAAPRAEARPTGETAVRAGQPCRRVEVFRGGEKIREHWVTDGDRLGLTRDQLGVFEDMSRFARDIAEAVGAGSAMANPMDALEDLGGFPVVTVDYRDGAPVRETTVRSVTPRDVPPEELAVPPGYTEQAMPGLPSRG